ncbi:MAG TPA: hypothetical protein VI815_01685 [Candidatus Nanoarchaeia archaeon]|nr:hypothetical protein [Candidatus Nanoarchaeia archaeon]
MRLSDGRAVIKVHNGRSDKLIEVNSVYEHLMNFVARNNGFFNETGLIREAWNLYNVGIKDASEIIDSLVKNRVIETRPSKVYPFNPFYLLNYSSVSREIR